MGQVGLEAGHRADAEGRSEPGFTRHLLLGKA